MTSRRADDRPASFDAALRAAREATGSADAVARLRVQLHDALAGHAAGGAQVAAGQPLAAAGVSKLPWLVAGCVGLSVACYLAVQGAAPTSRVPARAVSALAPPTAHATLRKAPAQAALAEPSAPALAPLARPTAPALAASREPTGPASPGAPTTRAPAPSSEPRSSAGHITAGAAQAVHSVGPAQRVATPSPPARTEAKPRELSRWQSSDPHGPESVAPPPTAAARGDSASEVSLITRAQALLDRQPEAALVVLLEHERQFPRGLLAEERDVLRFDAERALGHTAQAIADAQAFCTQHPASPQVRRLERWLAAQTNAAAVHKEGR